MTFLQLASFISAIMVVGGFVTILRGYAPLVFGSIDSFGRNIVLAVVIISAACVSRLFFWDILQFSDAEKWVSFRDAVGGNGVNLFFNAPLLISIYLLLKARLFAIPEDERVHWRWYTAWMHPEKTCFIKWSRK